MPSAAPIHTLSKWYDVPVGFVTPPLFWGSVLLYLRSLNGGCCSISDDLSCTHINLYVLDFAFNWCQFTQRGKFELYNCDNQLTFLFYVIPCRFPSLDLSGFGSQRSTKTKTRGVGTVLPSIYKGLRFSVTCIFITLISVLEYCHLILLC